MSTVIPFPRRRPAPVLESTACHVCGTNNFAVLTSIDAGLWALRCHGCGFVVMISEDAPDDSGPEAA